MGGETPPCATHNSPSAPAQHVRLNQIRRVARGIAKVIISDQAEKRTADPLGVTLLNPKTYSPPLTRWRQKRRTLGDNSFFKTLTFGAGSSLVPHGVHCGRSLHGSGSNSAACLVCAEGLPLAVKNAAAIEDLGEENPSVPAILDPLVRLH